MNKKFFTFLLFTFCFIGNLCVSAQTPARWTEGEPVQGGNFYLYNLGANRYLNQGSSWDTHAILDGAGLIVTSEWYEGGGSFKTNLGDGYLGLVGDGVWTDRPRQRLDLTPVNYGGYTNACILSCTVNGTTYYLGWAGGEGGSTGYLNNQVITITSYPTTEAFLWMLIDPQKRSTDYTYKITNPDFERGNYADYTINNGADWDNTNLRGWTRGGFWKQKTYTSFTNAAYAEKWTDSAPLGADKCYQTISDLPAGEYTLSVTAQAINQGNNNSACTKGVRLYLGNNSTIIGAAGTHSVKTTLSSGGSLELGVEILSDNDANWVAFDNVRLLREDIKSLAYDWDFTQNWTTSDLTEQNKLNGLIIGGNIDSGSNGDIQIYGGLRFRTANASVQIPVKAGQIVKIGAGSFDGNTRTNMTVYLSNADKSSVTVKSGDDIYCIAQADGYITVTRAADGTGNSNYFAIQNIHVDNAPKFKYNNSNYSVIASDGDSHFDLSAELIALQFNEPELVYPEGATVWYKSGNKNIVYCPQDQPQTIDGVTWKAEPDQVGQARFINTNYATVIAKVSYGGYTWGSTQEGDDFNLYYRVLVSADDVDSGTDDSGTTFVIKGNTNPTSPTAGGKLLSQDVHMPFLTARFGPDDVVNTSIVRDEPSIGLVITTLAKDGWRDAYFQDSQNPKKPTQGTFYKFVPTAPGELTVVGYIDSSAGGKAVLVDANANYAEVTPTNGSLDWSSNTTKMTTKFTLHKDHVYYLFGTNPNYDSNISVWATYQLQSFSFDATVGFDEKSVVLRNGETTYHQTMAGSGTITYSFDAKTNGTLNYAGNTSTGEITGISGDGGAIIVTAHDSGTDVTDFYVLTVPYSTTTWDFQSASSLDVNADRDYGVTYKVRNYYKNPPRHLYYLNVPVLCNKVGFAGQNAAYFGSTAGLILNGSVKTVGVTTEVIENTTVNLTPEELADAATLDHALKTMLAYGQDDVKWDKMVYLTMQKGAKLTIPNLKGGQYVRIKWARYYEKEGEFVRVTNLQDLDGNDINPNVPIRTWAPQSNRSRGYTVFKVKNDGDVTFAVTDEGWVNFYSIEVKNSFTGNTYKQIYEDIENHPEYANTTDTDLRLVIGSYTAGTSYSHNYGETGTVTYDNTASQYFQVGYSVHFSLEQKDANTPIPSASIETSGSSKVRRAPSLVTTSITDEGVLTTAGQGQAVVVQKATEVDSLGNTLVLDMQRTLITITQDVDITWDYPYTWDFTNISSKTLSDIGAANGGTGNANWQKNNDGSFKATDSFKDSFVQGGMLSSTGTYENLSTDATAQSGTGNRISEYEGLGFRTETEAASASGLDYIGITVPTDQPGEHGGAGGMVIGDKETTIVVPDVPEGMTVYVRVEPQENASVDVDGNTTKDFSATNTTTNKSEDVYSTTTAEAGDVELKLQNVVVKGIAVSNFKKTCYFRQGDTHVYYNTDSHALPIDYTLTKYYTNNAILAYEVYSISDKSVTLGLVEKGPENTGYVVSTEYLDDNTVQRPLFVPCANDIKNNMDEISTYSKATLLPHVEAGAIEGGAANRDHTHYDYYVLTNIYYQINQETDEFVSGPKTASVPGFYRVVSGDNSSLNRYRAYLKLPKSTTTLSGVKAIPLFDFDGELVDAIDVVSANATVGIDVNGTFYTLQGMKIQGLPKQGGVYIQNGKKVLVK